MIRNFGKNRALWLLTASLSLAAALIGVLSPGIYSKVISTQIMPGVISQDILTVIAAIVVLFLSIRMKEGNSKQQIVILGIFGYFFYAYGIYAIERVYNVLYFIYLAIFGLSFYSIVYGVASIRPEALQNVKLSNSMRYVAVGFSLFIAVLFNILWIGMLVPLIQAGQKIEFLYSVFILDLVFIMPAFVILAVMAARKQGLGLLLTPALYILGFTLLLPVGLGEFIKPFYNQPIDTAGVGLYLGISALFLILVIFYFRSLKIDGETT